MTAATPELEGERHDVRAAAVLALALVLFALLFPFTRAIADRLALQLLFAAISCLAAFGTADLFYRIVARVVREDAAAPSRAALLVVGYPLFGLVTHLISLFEINVALSFVLLLLPATWGCFSILSRARGADVQRARCASLRHVTPGAAMLFGVALTFAFLLAQLPASTLDELAYHLAVPKAWVNAGRVIELPLISHSYFPFAIESADIPLLSILGDDAAIASHFTHLFVAVATAIVMLQFAGRRTRSSTIHVAAIVTTPAFLITAGWSWVDVPLVGVAVVLLDSLEDVRAPRLAALALAAGLLNKYTFAPYALLLLAIAWLVASERATVIRSAIAGGVGGAFFYVKNLLLAANPFYPMFTGGGGETIGYRGASSLSRFTSYVYDPRFFDETLGVALFAFATIALLSRAERFVRLAAWALAAALVALVLLAPSSRILLPFAVPLALIGARLAGRSVVGRFCATVVALLQLTVVAIYAESMQPLSLFSLKTTETRYLEQHRRAYPAIRWADARLPQQSRTLVLGAQELFWFSREVRGGGNFDGPRVATYLAASSPDTLLQRLRSDGFTHVVVIADGIRVGAPSPDVKRRERELVLAPQQAAVLQRMLRDRTKLIARRQNVTVHELQR